jgi:YVTN family beta-propeller protein
MKSCLHAVIAFAVLKAACGSPIVAQEVPAGANAAPIPITSHDRAYHADQSSNTVSVYDPSNNTLLGVIPLGVAPETDQHPAWVNGNDSGQSKPPLLWASRWCMAWVSRSITELCDVAQSAPTR